MDLSEFAQQFLGVYDQVSAELGAVLALLFIAVFIIVMIVIFAIFLNSRSNAKFRAAQSDTLRTINDLVRTQSDRETKATDEAKRLNDMLLNQTIEFNNRFSEQAQRLTSLETKVPIYEAEIADLKGTRDTLITVVKAEREEWHKREGNIEKRHIQEMGEIKNSLEAHKKTSIELEKKLSALETRLEEREANNKTQAETSKTLNSLSENLVGLQVIIENLTKAMTNEFQKLREVTYSNLATADAIGNSFSAGNAERVPDGHTGSGNGGTDTSASN